MELLFQNPVYARALAVQHTVVWMNTSRNESKYMKVNVRVDVCVYVTGWLF